MVKVRTATRDSGMMAMAVAIAYKMTGLSMSNLATENTMMARMMAHPKSMNASFESLVCRGVPPRTPLSKQFKKL